jgi:hypothetical protein
MSLIQCGHGYILHFKVEKDELPKDKTHWNFIIKYKDANGKNFWNVEKRFKMLFKKVNIP